MPLTRYDDEIREDGNDVVFRMKDRDKLVPCQVTYEALADHTNSTGRSGKDLFKDNRELVERAASNLYEVGCKYNEKGRLVVTFVALEEAARGVARACTLKSSLPRQALSTNGDVAKFRRLLDDAERRVGEAKSVYSAYNQRALMLQLLMSS